MGQMGFFDVSNRYASLDARKDPLVQIAAVVPFEEFRSRLEAVWRKPGEKRTSAAGRKPWDAVVMLKAIILCEPYNLSDGQVEYQVRDRLSFMRFPGLGLEDPVPDARTIRLYREQLAQAGEVKPLFSAFGDHLKGRALWQWADRSLMRRSSRCPGSATSARRTRPSRPVTRQRRGRKSRPGCAGKIAMPAGPEKRPKPLRRQEPHQRRPPSQAGA